MNPAAPAWSSANTPAVQQRSSLDPTTAAFRPKSAHPGSGGAPPGKYAGNPVVTTAVPHHRGGHSISGARGHGLVYGGPNRQPPPAAPFYAHAQQPPSHHHARGGGHSTVIISAKSNTHWGSAGKPSNVQHTHHQHGIVHYNQTRQQQVATTVSHGTTTPTSPDSGNHTTPMFGATPPKVVLQEDVLFTPSTRDIWSGAAGTTPSDRALDSMLHASIEDQLLEGGKLPSAPHPQSDTIAVDTSFLDHLTASSDEESPISRQKRQGNPWTITGKQRAVASITHVDPKAHTTATTSTDNVDTVQHLLAQLTQEQEIEATPHAASTVHHHHARTVHDAPPPSKKRMAHVAPPAAIGGSPTSPDAARNGLVSRSQSSPQTIASEADGSPVMKAVPRSMQTKPTASTPQPSSSLTRAESSSTQPSSRSDPKPAADTTVGAPPQPVQPTLPDIHDRHDVEVLLADAKETLRHIRILSYSKQYPADVARLFQGWAGKGIPPPDDVFGAYYFYVMKKSSMELCMKHNGRGKAPGVGYGRCDFSNRGPNYKCRFHHVCLFCKGEDHGWFDEGKCERFQQYRREMLRLNLTDGDLERLVQAFTQ